MIFKKNLDKIISWENISILGKSKFIQSFSIWFIVTPILAKIFENINQVSFRGAIINIGMPFTFEVFYLCSLFFLIANMLYLFKCPTFIKNYLNTNDFIIKETKEAANCVLESLFKPYEGIGVEPNADEKEPSIRYAKNRNGLNLIYGGFRRLISVIYLIGVILIIWLVLENIYFVFFN